MTEPSIERMEDGLFARFGALLFDTLADGTVWVSRREDEDPFFTKFGAGATRAEAVRAAWTAERDNLRAEVDRLHKALAALGAPVTVDHPSDKPAGPETAQERPQAWAPMATCPRDAGWRLTEDVWLNSRGCTPVKFRQGDVLPLVFDRTDGRLGWLPGHIAEADLPPVEPEPEPETAQERVDGWRPMATCPRNAEAKLTEHVWVAYKDDVPRLWPPGLTVHPASETARGRLGWLPGHLNRSDLPPVEPDPEPEPERPQAWAPMDTCPRNADGKLTEPVWIAYRDGSIALVPPSRTIHPDFDSSFRRRCWLPGYLNRSDLPPVVVTP